MTQDYYGTKRVTAWRQEKENQAGYAVKYADGYISWSPNVVFENAYQPVTAMSFGHALVALKDGKKVARAGWNGRGMNLSLVVPAEAECLSYIRMKIVTGQLVPWLASQTDVLADDWTIVS